MTIVFTWDKNLSVGENTIDKQHQALLAQVNKIIEALVFGAHSQAVRDALAFFDTYIHEHLAYEEKYMEENNYPGTAEHTKKHSDFVEKYKIFKQEFDEEKDMALLAMKIEKFVGDWWINHIGHEDRKYALHISGAPVVA